MEGLKREVVRNVNALRKEAGLTIADRIVLRYETDDTNLKTVFEKFGTDILKDTLSKEIVSGRSAVKNEHELALGDAKVWIGF